MNTQQVITRHDTTMSLNYPRFPVTMAQGEGARLTDTDGKPYIDLFSGFGATVLGHCHPDLVAAVKRQAERLWHVGNLLHTEPQTHAAEVIARHGFGGRSFFSHSGADANEAAIKLARLYGREHPGSKGPRFSILSMHRSFHGRSFATMQATGDDKVSAGFEPLPEGFRHVPFNDSSAVAEAIDDTTVAIMVEPIQGEGGVHVPDDDYLPKLRALCDQHDLLLICDEVWTGCGRTGRWFGYQHWDFQPDIMTLGKGVGGGLAVGVMCAVDRVAELYDARKQGGVRHATTLGGNCLAMAVTTAVFEVIERDALLSHTKAMGRHAMTRLSRLAERCPGLLAVRGRGLFLGAQFEIKGDVTWFNNTAEVVQRSLDAGILVNAVQGNMLRLAPPLTIDQSTLDEGLDRLESILLG